MLETSFDRSQANVPDDAPADLVPNKVLSPLSGSILLQCFLGRSPLTPLRAHVSSWGLWGLWGERKSEGKIWTWCPQHYRFVVTAEHLGTRATLMKFFGRWD